MSFLESGASIFPFDASAATGARDWMENTTFIQGKGDEWVWADQDEVFQVNRPVRFQKSPDYFVLDSSTDLLVHRFGIKERS